MDVLEFRGGRRLIGVRTCDPRDLAEIARLARGGVCAVEWSENVEDALEGAIAVTIEKDPVQPDRRSITIEGGARFEALGL